MMVKLKDICDVDWGDTNLTKQAYVENGKYLGVSAGGCDGRMDYYDFESYTPVISAIGANCGKMFLPKEPFVAIKNTITLKPHKDILGEYIFYALLNNHIPHRGGGQPFISKADTEEYMISCPTLDQQTRIVNIFNMISNVIDSRQLQLSKLDELVKARFVELFGDLKTNLHNWQCLSLLDVAEIDTTMVTDYEKYADYPHIGIDSIEKNTGRLFGYRTIAEDGVISGKYLFTAKHIIYSKIRPNLNKVALPDFEGLCSADAYPILPKENVCLRIYLGYVMRSEFFLDYILPFSRRANMPKVNKEQLSGFVLPVPDIDLQKQFAAFVEQTDKSKSEIKKSLEKLETLKKALMQKYFG